MPDATFVYDGDCAFCSACARFVERYVRGPADVVPWQRADLDRLGLTEDECGQAVQWVDPDGRVAAGPAGIARLLRTAEGPVGRLVWRPAGAVLATRPGLTLAWPVYRWVARNRDRMPGGTPACALAPRTGTAPAVRPSGTPDPAAAQPPGS